MEPTHRQARGYGAARKSGSRRIRALAVCVFTAAALAGAAGAWAARSPAGRVRLRAVAGAVAAHGIELGLRVYDPYADVDQPVCNCSSSWQYSCDDLEAPYSQRVRRDPRLRNLFDRPPHELETYAYFQDFLRDRFRHGQPTAEPWLGREQYNLLEMLDDAESGSPFLCGDISKMFVQLVHAAGGFARIVSLSDPGGSGHVITEAWIERYGKWVAFDPDYNVYFTGEGGVPLSAAELHEIHRARQYASVTAHRGSSVNSVYSAQWHEPLLRHYHAIAFSRRANWIGAPLPAWHPGRHRIHTLSAWGESSDAFPPISVQNVVSDPDVIYFTPCRLSAATHQPALASGDGRAPVVLAAVPQGQAELGHN